MPFGFFFPDTTLRFQSVPKKKGENHFVGSKKSITFAFALCVNGTLAEWLGAGLQNRLRRFESARYLIERTP